MACVREGIGHSVVTALGDADYAKKAHARMSVSGVVVMLGNTYTVVSATGGAQKCTALLAAGAEYVALGHGAKQGLLTNEVEVFLQLQLRGMSVLLYEYEESSGRQPV